MDRRTIAATTAANLCSGCGACKGICPKDCIDWEFSKGMYLPVIDSAKCVQCGLCAEVCSGLCHSYEIKATAKETITGPVLECYNSWCTDPEIRHFSASGGVITTITRDLLSCRKYHSVFCLNTYSYQSQLQAVRFTKEDYLCGEDYGSAPKSRYLPVSHEETLRYMKAHRDERIIITGTSCALRSLNSAIEKLKLNRDNYLLIGLFCDSVFNYNILPYLEDHFCSGKRLSAFHFKNKDSGGWPGDMKLFPEHGDSFFVPIGERISLKQYFVPERCLYCVDKLNVVADISIGDNYTSQHSSKLGSNSVIVRTKRGMDAWSSAQSCLCSYPIEISEIQNAQFLEGRLNNLYFGMLKAKHSCTLNSGIPTEQAPIEFLPAWRKRLKTLNAGACYCTSPAKLKRQFKVASKKRGRIHSFLNRSIAYADKLWNKRKYS